MFLLMLQTEFWRGQEFLNSKEKLGTSSALPCAVFYLQSCVLPI